MDLLARRARLMQPAKHDALHKLTSRQFALALDETALPGRFVSDRCHQRVEFSLDLRYGCHEKWAFWVGCEKLPDYPLFLNLVRMGHSIERPYLP